MKNPLASTDRALVAYIISTGVGTSDNVYPFKRSESKTVPCIICYSGRATPVVPFDGTYEVEAHIFIRTTAAIDNTEFENEPIDRNDVLVDKVFDVLHRSDTGEQSTGVAADRLTTAARSIGITEWTCQSVDIVSIEASSEDSSSNRPAPSDSWTDTITLRLVVAAADVS